MPIYFYGTASFLKDNPAIGPLIIALIGAMSAIITLFIKDSFTEAAKRKTLRFERALDRVDEQISKFYAPLTILLVQLIETDTIKMNMIEKDIVHAKSIEKLAYNVYFFEIHEKIIQILQNQMHLLEGDKIPDCFDDYYKHVASERVFYTLTGLMAQAKDQGSFPVDAQAVSFQPFPFPKDIFPNEIDQGFKRVLKRQENLFRRLNKSRNFG